MRRTPVTALEVLRRILRRELHALPPGPLEIRCHHHDMALGRDLVDLVLGLRCRDWVWSDRTGRTEPGGRVLGALGALVREAALVVPSGWRRHTRAVAALERRTDASVRTRQLRRAAYLRSEPAFGIEAGGSIAHIAGVINAMRALDLKVDVLSTDRVPGVPENADFHLVCPGRTAARNFAELLRLDFGEGLRQIIERRWTVRRPDFLYHRYSIFNYTGPSLRAQFGVPYVCEYNGPLVWVQNNWEDRRLLLAGLAERIECLNLAAADLVVVVSEPLVAEAIKRGARPDRILVNPNGVDTDTYSPAVDGSTVRLRHGLGDAPVVGFIGTIFPWHGVEQLVEAAALVREHAPAVRFLVIGDGSRMDAVRRIVERANLHGTVVFTGLVPQGDGPAHLAACDILASPHVPNADGSPFFGSPTKVFEYMAMGRAIVASDLGQIGDVLEDGRTALLTRPGDPAAIAAAVLTLVRDGDLRRRLGHTARDRAVQQHTWRAHVQRVIERLRLLMDLPEIEVPCRA